MENSNTEILKRFGKSIDWTLAGAVIALQQRIVEYLKQNKGAQLTLEEIAAGAGAKDELETVFKVLRHLSANKDRGVKRTAQAGKTIFADRYSM